MPLRKLLFYGGCHAQVLRDLVMTLVIDIAPTLLVNFELIRQGLPFPFERLRDFDAVVYSPIENKGSYNTTHLADACRAIGVDAICFPWLEWHGYCPGAMKGDFRHRFQWRWEKLVEAATSFDNFDDFADWAISAFPDDATIDAVFERSTAMVREAEERHNMAVRVSDFILEHHRHRRLFLVSDHPSLMVYFHVLRQIFDLVGFKCIALDAGLTREIQEPQWRWRTPIFPRVAERLGLRFSDAQWIDDEVVPGRSLDLRSYLRLYYHSSSVILAPDGATSFHSSGTSTEVGAKTRLIADRLGRADEIRDEYRLLEILSDEALSLRRDQQFTVDKTLWRTIWG